MFHKASRKAPNVYTVLVAVLAALTAGGAVLGTVLLTRAPGATLGPKSVIMQALSVGFIGSFDGEEGLDSGPLTADPIVPNSGQALTRGLAGAVGRFWTEAGGVNRTLTMATANEIQAGTGSNALSGANTGPGGTTSSDGTLLLGGARTGGTIASNVGTLAVVDGDYSWTGATSTTWSTGSNWTGPNANTVPGSVDNAVFNSTFSNQPNLTANATIGGILMTSGVGQNVTISGSTTLTINGNTIPQIGGTPGLGILVDNSNAFTLTISENLKLGNDQTWTNNSGNLFTVSGAVNLNSNTLTVNGSGDTRITGVISGPGATSLLAKSGNGTLTVTGANTIAGTTVDGGTLLVNNTTGSGTGNGPVTVSNSGTTLGGTGATQQGRVTINAGANLAPGNGGHTTAVFSVGLLTLEPSSNFLVDINGTTVGTGYDQVQVTGAGGATGATINLSNLVVTVNATLTIGDQFVILHHAGGVSGQFAQGSTVTASNGDIFSIDYAALDSNGKPYNVTLTFTAVPEPSTWIGGAFALATLAFTQRRLFVRPLKRIALWSLNKS